MATVGSDHPAIARVLTGWASSLRQKIYGPSNFRVGEALNALGDALCRSGDFAAAHEVLVRALPIYEHNFGSNHHRLADPMRHLSCASLGLERTHEALSYARRAVALLLRQIGSSAAPLPMTRLRLAHAQFAQARAMARASQRDVKALSLARQARREFARHSRPDLRSEVQSWLASHR